MADPDGLIFGLRVDATGRVHELGWDDVEDASAAGGFLWLHLDVESERAARWVRARSGIDGILQDALLAEETRPRATVQDDALLLLLRGANLNPGEEPDDMVSLRLYADGRRLVTLRRRRLHGVERVRQELTAGRIEGDPSELLIALCDQLTRDVGDVVEDVEDRAAALEEQVLSAESRELRARISDLRRAMIALRRYLAPQREAFAQVAAARVSWLDERHRGRIREIADRTVRHVEELDAAREQAGVAYEELAGRLTERVEQRMYVLSLVAAVFLPLSFLTGLLGINVGGIPGSENPSAFAVVVAACAGLAFALLLWMRRRGWI